MHLQYVFYAPSHCHATPKINFYHLKNDYFAKVIRPKTTNPSVLLIFLNANEGLPHGQPPYLFRYYDYKVSYFITTFLPSLI